MVNYFQIDQPLPLPTIITEENNLLTKPSENGQLQNKIVSFPSRQHKKILSRVDLQIPLVDEQKIY